MASSITFPDQKSESNSSLHPPPTAPRPPHLPFRRISLPSVPHGLEHRHSVVSVSSFNSTLEENQADVPPPMKNVSKPAKVRPPARPRRESSNRRKEVLTDVTLEEKRRKVINEIFDTERAYVEGLDLIYTKFLMPLIASLDTSQPLLDRAELTSVFSNFIDIWNLHRSFFTSLTTLLSKHSDPLPPLSPILMSHFPYLSLYTPFVTSFPTILSSLTGLQSTNPAFANFIRMQEADPRCGKLSLQNWLLTIVQRCPRYLLLLKDLMGCTEPSDPEHASLTAVHTLLSKITQSLNTSLHTHAQTLALLSLQRATPNLPFQLISPGRSLVRRGPLRQGQAERSASDEREFLLFSDCLVWLARVDHRSEGKEWGGGERRPKIRRGRSKSETELPTAKKLIRTDSGTEERWVFKGRAELVDLEVVLSPSRRKGREEDDERKRFDVLSPEASFALYATTEEERDAWMTAIRNAKSSLLVSLNMMHPNSTLTSSQATTHLRRALQALPHAPDEEGNPARGKVDHFVPAIWVPDSKTESCMRCGARFGWRRRRHHCRLCGRCICASCSGKTFFISDSSTNSTKPARACNACYESVFPLLAPSTSSSTLSTQPQHEGNPSNISTLGTLSQLPSWQSVPSFGTPGGSGSGMGSSSHSMALFNPPPSAFHEARRPRMRPRPQSQPVMAALDLYTSPSTSANASSLSVNLNSPLPDMGRSVVSLNSEVTTQIHPDTPVEDEPPDELPRPDPKRFSMAAVAVHTAPVTARPSVFGEGKGRRFSLLLSGKNTMQKKMTQQRRLSQESHLDQGVAAGKLSEILGRGKRDQV